MSSKSFKLFLIRLFVFAAFRAPKQTEFRVQGAALMEDRQTAPPALITAVNTPPAAARQQRRSLRDKKKAIQLLNPTQGLSSPSPMTGCTKKHPKCRSPSRHLGRYAPPLKETALCFSPAALTLRFGVKTVIQARGKICPRENQEVKLTLSMTVSINPVSTIPAQIISNSTR